jgi:excinuclease ABC subunit A
MDVGLGYLRLGQSATTLSGGEAQRVKLARELGRRETGNTLYILDLGPGGGVNGGEIVAEGTPEQVAAEPRSFTGQYLGPLLARQPASVEAELIKPRKRRAASASNLETAK